MKEYNKKTLKADICLVNELIGTYEVKCSESFITMYFQPQERNFEVYRSKYYDAHKNVRLFVDHCIRENKELSTLNPLVIDGLLGKE